LTRDPGSGKSFLQTENRVQTDAHMFHHCIESSGHLRGGFAMNTGKVYLRLLVCLGIVVGLATLVDGAGDYSTESDCFWDFFGGQTGNVKAAESIAGAGDLNGDGYDDLIIGSRWYNTGSQWSGVAWVFYGSASGYSDTADVTLLPPIVEYAGFFGFQVAAAGDVNNDGYDDVMVGMMNYGGIDEGAIFVYYGSDTGIGPTHDWMCRAGIQWAHLGWGAASAGDVNGDNYDDIIVGGFDYALHAFHGALVFHGSATGLDASGTRLEGNPDNADWRVNCTQTDAYFGIHVGSAGDVNGDGYDEVFVGAPQYTIGESHEGVLFLWYGSASGLGATPTTEATADWIAQPNQANAYMTGTAEATAADSADLNNDGYDDLVVAAWQYVVDVEATGLVMAYYGSPTGLGDDGTPDNADWVMSGLNPFDNMGGDVKGIGDFNGDGFEDVAVGATGWDVQGPPFLTVGGMVSIWYGGKDGIKGVQPYYADVMIEGEQQSAQFGRAIAAAGDINNDGNNDIVVASPFYSGSHVEEGAAFAFWGEPITFIDDFETGDTLRWSNEVN
jgi:hypothetical protein